MNLPKLLRLFFTRCDLLSRQTWRYLGSVQDTETHPTSPNPTLRIATTATRPPHPFSWHLSHEQHLAMINHDLLGRQSGKQKRRHSQMVNFSSQWNNITIIGLVDAKTCRKPGFYHQKKKDVSCKLSHQPILGNKNHFEHLGMISAPIATSVILMLLAPRLFAGGVCPAEMVCSKTASEW